jgi:SAM-dependent methyltransferase
VFVNATEPMSGRRLSAVDEYLAAAAGELFAHDDRLWGVDIGVRFDRGVAHLSGDLTDRRQLRLVRDLLGRLDGVLAVWSRVRLDGREPLILDLGCGETKQYRAAVGVDRHPSPAVDVLADLTSGLPVADSCVDAVFAVHVIEHLVDFLPLVDECHRVLRPDGVLHLLSPWWRFVNAVADPTHVRLIDMQTVKGICERRGSPRRWYPLHVACDGATVFADLTPLPDGAPAPSPGHLARFFA